MFISLATSRRWFATGKSISISDAPTVFGKTALSTTSPLPAETVAPLSITASVLFLMILMASDPATPTFDAPAPDCASALKL